MRLFELFLLSAIVIGGSYWLFSGPEEGGVRPSGVSVTAVEPSPDLPTWSDVQADLVQ